MFAPRTFFRRPVTFATPQCARKNAFMANAPCLIHAHAKQDGTIPTVLRLSAPKHVVMGAIAQPQTRVCAPVTLRGAHAGSPSATRLVTMGATALHQTHAHVLRNGVAMIAHGPSATKAGS